MGLTAADLRPTNGTGATHGHPTYTTGTTKKNPTGSEASNQVRGRIVAEYSYENERGELLYQNVRFDPKDFKARRKGSDGEWIWNLDGVRRVPYHLPQLLASNKKLVLLCEGEKDVEAAEKLGFTATSLKNWRPEWNGFLREKAVAIIVDADESGRKQANDAALMLAGRESLTMFELPGSKEGGDLSDFVVSGGKREALCGFIELQKDLGWRGLFDSYQDFLNAPPLTFAIEGILQNDAATIIGGLSGHAKTWFMLSITKALLIGAGDQGQNKLWGHFPILTGPSRVVYLIPESARSPFKHRLEMMGLMPFVQNGQLLVRTLNMGPAPNLDDPKILAAVNGAYSFLDTLARWCDGDENSAGENQALANNVFAMLSAGAKAVTPAHHAPKGFAQATAMSLENIIRGSGDIGAMFATGWGIKLLDRDTTTIHIENIKPRDFEPPKPFQLIGRPHIYEEGDFRMHKKPGECGELAEEQPTLRGGGGREDQRQAKASNLALLRTWLASNPTLTLPALQQLFTNNGITIDKSTISRYRKDLGL
jgi:hypothetical protein